MQMYSRLRFQNKIQEPKNYHNEFTHICVNKSEKIASLSSLSNNNTCPDINNKIFDIYRDLLI
jgi:hypothetical protein